jgi:hypothetical protein
MSHLVVDLIVLFVLFAFGLGWTVTKYSRQDRIVFTVVAILSPAIAVFSVFRLVYLVLSRKTTIGPVPPGLEEAEMLVAKERQILFGGTIQTPHLARSWQRAYELELQREAESVQRTAARFLVPAA